MSGFRAFAVIPNGIPEKPGIYDIRIRGGDWLKVGIAKNLRTRLQTHRASRQSGLKLKPGGQRSRPVDVVSKSSVLAKHLYYDNSVAPDYNLRSETGRRSFLDCECEVRIKVITDVRELKRIEKKREKSGRYRYVGRVLIR